jgi:hypothetical protein
MTFDKFLVMRDALVRIANTAHNSQIMTESEFVDHLQETAITALVVSGTARPVMVVGSSLRDSQQQGESQ